MHMPFLVQGIPAMDIWKDLEYTVLYVKQGGRKYGIQSILYGYAGQTRQEPAG